MKVVINLHRERTRVTNREVTAIWQDDEFFCLRQGKEEEEESVKRMYVIDNIFDIEISGDD